jgi:hypothetical protein
VACSLLKLFPSSSRSLKPAPLPCQIRPLGTHRIPLLRIPIPSFPRAIRCGIHTPSRPFLSFATFILLPVVRALCRGSPFPISSLPISSRPVGQIVVYAVVLFGLWTIPGARLLINPLKLFAIGWHELCHAILVRSPPYSFPGVHTPRLTSRPTVGDIDGRNDHAHVDRSHNGWIHHRARWPSSFDPLCRLHRFHAIGRFVHPWRLRHACVQNPQLRCWHWADSTIISGPG